jgi:hypothetical protein
MQFKDTELESTWQNEKGQVFKVVEQKTTTTIIEMIYPEIKRLEVLNNNYFNNKQYIAKRAWGKVEGTRAKVIHEELETGGTIDDVMIRVVKRTNDKDLVKVRKHIIARISYLRTMGLLKEDGTNVRSLENQKEV